MKRESLETKRRITQLQIWKKINPPTITISSVLLPTIISHRTDADQSNKIATNKGAVEPVLVFVPPPPTLAMNEVN